MGEESSCEQCAWLKRTFVSVASAQGYRRQPFLAQCTVGLWQRLSSDSGTFSGFSAVRQQHIVRVCNIHFSSQVSRSMEVDLGFSSFVTVCVLAELGAHP